MVSQTFELPTTEQCHPYVTRLECLLTPHHFRPWTNCRGLFRVGGGGVLNFHFGIGVGPEGPQMGLKERVGTKNRGLTLK